MTKTVRKELAVTGLLDDLACRFVNGGRDSAVGSYFERSFLCRMHNAPQSLVSQRYDRVW